MDRTFKEDQKANAVNISFIIITLVVLCWNLTAVSIAATKTEQLLLDYSRVFLRGNGLPSTHA